jgi:hypothetical protein
MRWAAKNSGELQAHGERKSHHKGYHVSVLVFVRLHVQYIPQDITQRDILNGYFITSTNQPLRTMEAQKIPTYEIVQCFVDEPSQTVQ